MDVFELLLLFEYHVLSGDQEAIMKTLVFVAHYLNRTFGIHAICSNATLDAYTGKCASQSELGAWLLLDVNEITLDCLHLGSLAV